MDITSFQINKIVDSLYNYMADDLNRNDEAWIVHPNQFLPANVCCDYIGMQRFKNMLRDIIVNGLKKEDP
jgi:hypothetical protein